MARHQDLLINHILESWSYANATARTTAVGFVAGDLGRIAYQTDTGEYWRLTATTPTWARVSVMGTATFQTASIQSPTGTTSTTGTMAGLGTGTWGSALITPVRSGKVFVTICGTLGNSSTGGGQTAIHYGTGSVPSNGDPVTGTAIGGIAILGTSNVTAPFSCSAVITGLTLGTPVYLDLVVVRTGGAGTTSVSTVEVSAFELP